MSMWVRLGQKFRSNTSDNLSLQVCRVTFKKKRGRGKLQDCRAVKESREMNNKQHKEQAEENVSVGERTSSLQAMKSCQMRRVSGNRSERNGNSAAGSTSKRNKFQAAAKRTDDLPQGA